MLRFLIGLLVGAILGAGGTAYFFSTGGGDYLIASSPRVRHLEEELRRANQEQDRLAKKLDEAAAVIEKMTAKFTELERRFQTLESPSPKSMPPAEKHEEEPGKTTNAPST